MSIEIERRFLAAPSVLAECRGSGRSILQGYLWSGPDGNSRIRIEDSRGTLTRKGPKHGCCRREEEAVISLACAVSLLSSLPRDCLVRKTRYQVPVGGLHWDVDVFTGRHEGLIIAEIELRHPGQLFLLPPWVRSEVTADKRFGNSSLARAGAVPTAA